MKVKCLKDKNVYVLVIPNRTHGTGMDLASGQLLKVNGTEITKTGNYTFKNKKPTVKLFEKVTVFVKAVPIVDGFKELSAQEYHKQLKKLKSKQHCADDEDEYTWASLEDEYAYRKFVQSYKKINRVDEVFVQDIECETAEKITFTHPNITFDYTFDNDITSTYGTYHMRGHILDIVRKIFKEHGMVEEDKNNPFSRKSLSNEYKIYDHSSGDLSIYVDGSSIYRYCGRTMFHERYKVLLAKIKETELEVNKVIEGYLKLRGVVTFDAAKVITHLNTIESKIRSIDSKVNSVSEHQSALNSVIHLREQLLTNSREFKIKKKLDKV